MPAKTYYRNCVKYKADNSEKQVFLNDNLHSTPAVLEAAMVAWNVGKFSNQKIHKCLVEVVKLHQFKLIAIATPEPDDVETLVFTESEPTDETFPAEVTE